MLRKGTLLVVFAAGLICSGVASAQLITGVSESGTALNANVAHFTGQTFDHPNLGAGYTVPFLDEDVAFFTNRLHQYNGYDATHTIASMNLVGAEYVMMANENRGVADYKLTTSVNGPVDAFVFMDRRVVQPTWLTNDGWTFLGNQQMGIDEDSSGVTGVGPGDSINNRFWVWKKSITSSSFDTLERGGSGNNMYGVAVTAPGGGPSFAPLSGADWKPGNFGLIDLGATGGRAEPGSLKDGDGLSQIGAGPHNTNGTNLPARQMVSATGDAFTVTIDNVNQIGTAVGGLDWRDKGDSPLAGGSLVLPLAQLAEDHLKNNDGIIRVTLSDLAAGVYDVTSFHIDATGAQCEAIKIFVDNGDGNGYVDTTLVGSSLVNPGLAGVMPQFVIDNGRTFSFTADGIHDVMIVFDGTAAADKEVTLSGLNINFIPEPASLSLLAFGGLALLARRKRD